MTPREATVRELWRRRPRSRFLRVSAFVLGAFAVAAFFLGDFAIAELFSSGSVKELSAFFERVTPKPVRGEAWNWTAVGHWAGDLLQTKGWTAAGTTLAISVAAIVLAALGGLLLCLPAARTFATPDPYAPSARPPSRFARLSWGTLRVGTRGFLIFLRSIPEYVWAFLLFGMLGPNAWPAVLALALHNAGILGRLYAEVVENLPPAPSRSLRALGASRPALAVASVYPAALPRFLLYFFYRWETCVREATVLGMLGIASLGFLIDDARHAFRYDELVLWILVGSSIVLAGDLLSAIARAVVRRAA